MRHCPKHHIAVCVDGTIILSLLPLADGCTATGAGGSGRSGWVELFNGRDLTGWRPESSDKQNAWQPAAEVLPDPAAKDRKFVIKPGTGILVNGPKGRAVDLLTETAYGDCQAHIEFMVAKRSNSGVYLQGRYELQIEDSFGKAPVESGDSGAIYERWIDGKGVDGTAPLVNASKPPGQWQTFDIVFRAPRFDAAGKKTANACFVKVVHNGQVIHENVELNGPTRGAIGDSEVARGPLRLQGDHGPIAYRNLRLRPLN